MKNGVCGFLFAMGLAAASAAPAASVADGMQVSGAYARAVPPGQPNSAAFLSLRNDSDEDHALVAAESAVAKIVELHRHTMDGGMMRMRPVAKIELPAGQTVTLQPGGLHVMLIGLDHQLLPGEQVELALIYEDGSRTRLSAPVQKVQAMRMQHHQH
jgi:copper(I)-binding protein